MYILYVYIICGNKILSSVQKLLSCVQHII